MKVALVTGARGGIGAAIVERLEADGWTVHGVDVDDADLTTRDGNRQVVDDALAAHGRLDAIVPNAGFQHVAPIADFPEEQWDRLLALLLTSPFLLAKHAWQALAAGGDGRICVIASAHALTASPFKAGYVAAKHGVLGLVKTLALEGAPVGISATAVCPAYVRTPLVEAQIAAQAASHGLPAERVLEDVILERQAVKRLLEPVGGGRPRRLPARPVGPGHHRGAGAARPRLDRGLSEAPLSRARGRARRTPGSCTRRAPTSAGGSRSPRWPRAAASRSSESVVGGAIVLLSDPGMTNSWIQDRPK